MKRCVIIGGADIADYEGVRKHLKSDDFYIFCDSGLKHKDRLKIEPHLIIGDFDSHKRPKTTVETVVLPCEKDDTDTVFAAKEAVKRGFGDFLLIGVIGQRLDHTLCNVSILLMLDSLGKKAKIIDDYSEMEIISSQTAYIDDSVSYFSLINIGGIAEGISIENAKYPLKDAVITPLYQYGVSNEVIKGMTAKVSLKKGTLLLIKIKE